MLLLYFIEIPLVNAHSVDPDQMPSPVTSDLGLHCLPITFLEVYRLKSVKTLITTAADCIFSFFFFQRKKLDIYSHEITSLTFSEI